MGSFRLAPTSPCLNGGTNRAWMAGASDLEGRPRILGVNADMGAYESEAALLVVTFPPDATVSCEADRSPAGTGVPVVDTDCGFATDVRFEDEETPGACPQALVIARTWTATNACGGEATGVQTIVVEDGTSPVLGTVPADATVACDAVPEPAVVTVSDNCDPEPALAFEEVATEGACPGSYTLTRTWTAADACGNPTAATQQIVVVDGEAPVIDGVPGDATVACDAVPEPAAPSASDACDPEPSLVFDEARTDGDCLGNYTLTRTWTSTDHCGNTAVAVQALTVRDTDAPALIGMPEDATVGCHDVPAPGAPAAVDNCDPAPSLGYDEAREDGPCADSYTLVRTWTTADVCGNATAATQRVAVVDNVAPVLAGVPPDATVECDSVPAPSAPTAADNCDPAPAVALAESRTDGPCSDTYTLTRTWTATDRCGNAAQGVQTLSVVDTRAPAFEGLAGDVEAACDAVPAAPDVTARDCGAGVDVQFAEERKDGACPDAYTLVRRWTAADDCGHSASVTQVVTVADTVAPVLQDVPPSVTVECDSVPAAASPTVADNCDPAPSLALVEVREDGPCAGFYTLARTWTATDRCGNSAEAVQAISVVDTQPPVLEGVEPGSAVECDAVPPPAAVTATDCGAPEDVEFSEVREDGACADSYALVRTWTATDACGQMSEAAQRIDVFDSIAPVLQDLPADETVECDAVPAAPSPAVADNCDPAPALELVETREDGPCAGAYTLARTWRVTDRCGNASEAVQTIVVVDTTPPALVGVPADETVEAGAIPPPADVTATDLCEGSLPVTLDETSEPGECPVEQILLRTWRAVDGCGNEFSQTQTIVAISVDGDGDGLSDCTEAALGTNPLDADTDDDGMGDGDEVRAGTDPLNPASFLGLVQARAAPGGAGFVVRWSSADGRTYRIERLGDLVSQSPVTVVGGLPAFPPLNTYTDTTAVGVGPWFYYIELEEP
jgi:hypothetical protein